MGKDAMVVQLALLRQETSGEPCCQQQSGKEKWEGLVQWQCRLIPQHLCEELFLQSPRRTICSCSLDHAGSSVTFQQIDLCIFEIKERADECRDVLLFGETEGVTILKLLLVPSRNHEDNLKIIMVAVAMV
jgi:hypothetical protein